MSTQDKLPPLPAQPEVPTVCDGKEQDAFEAWAKSERYDTQTHPLHWLFLDAKTYAARQGWKAALHYAAQQTAAALPASAPQPASEFDVRRILLDVVPGDGNGEEVYAKSVADVEAKFAEMWQRIEELESALAALAAQPLNPQP